MSENDSQIDLKQLENEIAGSDGKNDLILPPIVPKVDNFGLEDQFRKTSTEFPHSVNEPIEEVLSNKSDLQVELTSLIKNDEATVPSEIVSEA